MTANPIYHELQHRLHESLDQRFTALALHLDDPYAPRGPYCDIEKNDTHHDKFWRMELNLLHWFGLARKRP